MKSEVLTQEPSAEAPWSRLAEVLRHTTHPVDKSSEKWLQMIKMLFLKLFFLLLAFVVLFYHLTKLRFKTNLFPRKIPVHYIEHEWNRVKIDNKHLGKLKAQIFIEFLEAYKKKLTKRWEMCSNNIPIMAIITVRETTKNCYSNW